MGKRIDVEQVSLAPVAGPVVLLVLALSNRKLGRSELTAGARAEDLHDLLFDRLQPYPLVSRFMIFAFWQKQVSRWNSKPLLVTDPAHQTMIKQIEAQRDLVRQRHPCHEISDPRPLRQAGNGPRLLTNASRPKRQIVAFKAVVSKGQPVSDCPLPSWPPATVRS